MKLAYMVVLRVLRFLPPATCTLELLPIVPYQCFVPYKTCNHTNRSARTRGGAEANYSARVDERKGWTRRLGWEMGT